jgi:hypothetical protein
VAAERRIDRAVALDRAQRQREVVPLHRARLHLAHQVGLRRQRLRHHQQAAGVLVEAMHDAGAGNAGQLRRMVQQRVEQGARGIAVARMHHQAGRLVDHDQRFVLEHDGERDVFGRDRRSRPAKPAAACERHRCRGEFDALAAINLALGLDFSAVEADQALLQPALQAAARMLGKELGQHRIEPPAGAFRGDFRARDVAGLGL